MITEVARDIFKREREWKMEFKTDVARDEIE